MPFHAFVFFNSRAVFSLIVMCSIFIIIYISLQLSQKFSNSPLSTVVESTIFPVTNIPFPAVSICNNNRFHRDRCEEAEEKFLPNVDNETLEVFRILLRSLNGLEFGAFDDFYEEVFNFTSSELNSLNLTEVIDFVMLKCEEIFVGKCWWRNRVNRNKMIIFADEDVFHAFFQYIGCCEDFFYLTRSEYGLCFSFNSAVTESGIEKDVKVEKSI